MPDPNLEDVPDFEKAAASGMQLVPGNNPKDIAHVDDGFVGRNRIYVDDPKELTQPILDHEVMHKVQQKAGNLKSVGDDPDYNYGDLTQLRNRGGSVANLDSEKQAAVVEDYTGLRQALAARAQKQGLTPKDLSQADADDKNYGWAMHQFATMAQPGNTINTTPAPPGPPPAALTGIVKPLPEVGGQTLYATHPKTGHTVMTNDGGKSWQPAR